MQNHVIQTSIVKVLDDINRMINMTEIVYDELFEFEKMIITNDNIENIKEYVSQNENIIYEKTMLCNGYYKKKFKTHPSMCHHSICYKSPLYYSLWLNCYYYQNIFSKIKTLATLSTKEILSEFLSFIYSLPCVCHLISTYKNNYDHDDMNFYKINMFLKVKMIELFGTYEDYKSHLTKKNNITKNFKLQCAHECVGNTIVKKLDFIQDEINNYDKIGDLIFELKWLWEEYNTNCEIVKYLFGLQSYEYYDIHLNYKKLDTERALDKILLNKYTNINFCKNDDQNLLYNTMRQDCKQELVIKILENGGKLPRNKNLETMFENRECKIENIKIFLQHYDEKYFSNESLLTILKQNLMKTHKIEIVNIFASRGLLSNAIKILLESDDSHNILLNLYNSEDIVCSKIAMDDVLFCIKLEKYKELDLILTHNKSFANEVCNDTIPIMVAIKENKLKCLKLLLQHGADPFQAYDGLSPIMLTILENRLDMLEFLLLNWMKNCSTSDNTSHIMLAIKEDNIEVLKLLLKYKADPFSSIGDTTPTLYAIENDKITSLECLLIYGSEIEVGYNPVANKPYKQITPLSLAIDKNKLVAFELLLKYGADPFIYTRGLNILQYAIVKNNYECVSLVKDYKKENKCLINELTSDELKKHPIFLAVSTKDPIKFSDLLLQNTTINYNHVLNDGSNILNYILASKNKYQTKINLFKRYINKNIDLTNQVNDVPLVVYAVDNNMFDIVVMIINKLIELEEITINGYTKNDNIVNIIATNRNKKLQIISKNKSKTNYYSLVLVYLKQDKTDYIDENDNENTIISNESEVEELNFHNDFSYVITNTAINAINTTNSLNFKEHDNVRPLKMSLDIDNIVKVKINMDIIIRNLCGLILIILVGVSKYNNPISSEMKIIIEKLKKCKDEEHLMKYLTKLVDDYYNDVYFTYMEGYTKYVNTSETDKYDIIGAFSEHTGSMSDSEYDYNEHNTSIDYEYTDICFPVI
jgi:hypothetical protein